MLFGLAPQTLRVTPAMEAGITNHASGIQETVGLLKRKPILADLYLVARMGRNKERNNPGLPYSVPPCGKVGCFA
jgi:hypothetical protein